MPDVLWWLQVIGGVFSVVLTAGGVVAAIWTTARDAPNFMRRLTGVSKIEAQMDRLHNDHVASQELQRQQAEAFNELSEVVCEQHNIDDENRPDGMDTYKIRRDLLREDVPNFRRDDD